MRFRLALLALAVTLVAVVAGVTAAPSAQAAPSMSAAAPITPAQSGGTLAGVFEITNFTVNSAGQLVANGVFNGTATVGGVTQTLTNVAASAVVTEQQAGGSCRILDLVLGPLHLDLLGLVIDLNQVHLTITAERGPGNLLGNLLCAIAGLLDGTGGGNALQQLLAHVNRILGA